MLKKIAIFIIFLFSFNNTNATNLVYFVPENIEYCENLYFSDFKEFNNIWCDLELVEKRVYEVKKWIYDENNYINYNDLGSKIQNFSFI